MKEIDKAINYAASTNKIEDMNLSKKELKEIKDAIVNKKDTKVFIHDLFRKNKNGKNK